MTARYETSTLTRPRSRRMLVGLGLITLVVAVLAPVAALGGLGGSAPHLSVFPIPGSRVVAPGAQIAFRGAALHHLHVTVTGSRSGLHAGRIRVDSDGDGGSFLPNKPFTPGETVTVATNQHVLGAAHGRFHFVVARPAGHLPYAPLPLIKGAVQRFHSQPDLAPAAVAVASHAGRSPTGDIFLAPQQGPVQNGPMIVDQTGQLIWFLSLGSRYEATDFRVQHYQGKPVLTWWQGYLGAGAGSGEDLIMDTSYRQIATVRAADGLTADLHEFQLTPHGTALITAYFPVYWNASRVHAASRQIVMDSVVQEIDVKTGLLLFQWDSLDHVPLTDSYEAVPKTAGSPLDHFHVNSIEEDRDGNLLISSRDDSAIYKVDHRTGRIIWTLGGKHSSFKMAPGSTFFYQHDARVRSDGDRILTLFDNGGGPPRTHAHSRGMTLALNFKHMTARRVAEYEHHPAVPANYEGNVQRLPGGDVFLGWGQQPYFAEFDSRGRTVLDGRFVPKTANYRAYLFPWRAKPADPPAVSATSRGANTVVYASWNGATDVASWRVLGGDSPQALSRVATVAKDGFETETLISAHRFVAVQALDRVGRVLGTSSTVQAS